MAHFAKIGINSKVIGVHAVNTSDCLDANGVENDEVGRLFLENVFHYPFWVKTSYNTRGGKHYTNGVESADQTKAIRGNYGTVGMVYDEDKDLFYWKQPYPSWVLDIPTATWHSPIGEAPEFTIEQKAQMAAATHNYTYIWNEDGQSWDLDTQTSD